MSRYRRSRACGVHGILLQGSGRAWTRHRLVEQKAFLVAATPGACEATIERVYAIAIADAMRTLSCPIRERAAAARDIAMAESCGKPKADLLSSPSSSHAPDPEWLGPAYTLIGAFGFSAKSIFAKLA